MALITHKPTSPGRRDAVSVRTEGLHKGAPYAALTEAKTKNGGRNNYGRITVRHQGGGHKQRYRIIDFKRDKEGIAAKVERIEYDPNRTAHIALLCYADGERRYIIAPKGVQAGDRLVSGSDAPIKAGNSLPLRAIRWVRPSTASRCVRARVRRLRVPPALRSSWLLANRVTPRCVCAPAKCAACRSIAAPPSVKWATASTA